MLGLRTRRREREREKLVFISHVDEVENADTVRKKKTTTTHDVTVAESGEVETTTWRGTCVLKKLKVFSKKQCTHVQSSKSISAVARSTELDVRR